MTAPRVFMPHTLLDFIIKSRGLKNDASLARTTGMTPAVISKLRHRRLSVSAQIIIDLHLKLDIPVRDIIALIPEE